MQPGFAGKSEAIYTRPMSQPKTLSKLIACATLASLFAGAATASGPGGLPPEIANATIHGTEYGPVTLHDGVWEGEPWVEGGSSRPRVGLASDFLRAGDLDGDGRNEHIVIVWQSSGGSGTFNYVALMDEKNGAVMNTATTALGDRVKVLDGQVNPGRVELQVIEHDEDDPACCPTRHATRYYNDTLEPIETP